MPNSDSLHSQELQVKGKVRVRGDAWQGLFAIGKIRGYDDSSLAAGRHASNANVPPFDDFAFAELEAERFP